MTYEHQFRPFSELFGVRRERTSVPKIAKAACEAGMAVIAVHPGTKIPMCTLTSAELKKADQAARDAAQAAGKVRWSEATHDCGRAHAITEPKDATRIFTRLMKQGEINIGIEPGKSGWVAVDVDQAPDVDQWMAMWAERAGDPNIAGAAPTVSSPGVYDAGGDTWRHKGGGHIWYWLPPGMSFVNSGVHRPMPMLGGAASVYFNDALVLVPPSTRPEGEYILQSDACQAPDWLVDAILEFIDHQATLVNQRHAGSLDNESPIDRWSATVSWDELLEPDGWRYAHKVDKCACPIWTRPGDDASTYKSATAHEMGCLRYDIDPDESPGFLHLWTDNPPSFLAEYVRATGKKSITKFNYLAYRDHDGESVATMRHLGIGRAAPELVAMDATAIAALNPAPDLPVFGVYAPAGEQSGGAREGGAEDGDESDRALPQPEGPATAAPDDTGRVYYTADEFDQIPDRESLIFEMLVRQSYFRIIGKSNHGKSFLAVDLAGHIVTGRPWRGRAVAQGRVAYIAAEDAPGIIARVKAWEHHHDARLGKAFLLRVEGVQVKDDAAWMQLIRDMQAYQPEVIFIDTQAASTYGMEENNNDEGSNMNRRMIELQRMSGAAVGLIHHKGHDGANGRGASSIVGALDTEISIDKDTDNEDGRTWVTISCPKQKNWAQFADIRGEIVAEPGTKSAVLTGVTGGVLPTLRPLGAPAGAGTGTVPAPDNPAARIAAFIYKHGNGAGGVLKSEISRELAFTRKDNHYPRMHREQLARALKVAIEKNWLVDVATGYPVVAEGHDAFESIVFNPARRVVLADAAIQELNLND